jgi:hemerythrin superfamily protein
MASDAVTLICRDHRVMQALLDQLKDPASDRVALVEEVAARFTAHVRAEEEQIYPLLVFAEPENPHEGEEVRSGVQEHRAAEDRLRTLRATDPDSADFEIALRGLEAAVINHVEEEESELLPDLVSSVDRETLETVGAAFDARRIHELRVYGFEDWQT